MSEVTKDLSKRVRFNFWIPESTYSYLESVAVRDGRSMSDILRECIRRFQVVDTEEQRMLEEKNQD